MKRYTREEMLRESGARPEELVDLEDKRLLVPNRPWRLWGSRQEFYTEAQLDVLRYFVKKRRVAEASLGLSLRLRPSADGSKK